MGNAYRWHGYAWRSCPTPSGSSICLQSVANRAFSLAMRSISILVAITLVALADPLAPLNTPAPNLADRLTSHASARIFNRFIRASADFTEDGMRPIGSLLNVTKRMSYGQSAWSDEKSFSGPVWIQIDLSRQILSVSVATTKLVQV